MSKEPLADRTHLGLEYKYPEEESSPTLTPGVGPPLDSPKKEKIKFIF